jgi:two-component system, NtrC family, nitrogen regulation sensor histidine kinase NtrY
MSLRRKFLLYLALTHLLFAGVAVYLLRQHRLWLLAVEAVFVASLYAGWRLIRGLFSGLDLVKSGAQFISDSDFTARFNEAGHPELDQLIQVYNRMVDHLREERVRLQEQNYFLDKVLTASPSGVVTLDFDGRVALVNPSALKMLGLPRESLIGRRLDELPTPLAPALGTLAVGEAKVLPLQAGRRVRCQRAQFLDRGFARHFILIEELTEELRQTEKAAYERLIRLMSHEVNNSVGAANSLLHSCLHYAGQLSADDRPDFEHALGVVIARTDQLSALMKSFADVARLPPPRLEPCDVRRLVEDVAVLLRAESERRRVAWEWEVRERLEPIPMDPAQMEQAFVNVCKNALEAIGESGRIKVQLGRLSGRAFVTVEDSGGALTPEVREHLFTPFFTTKPGGQGIGLTLVREVLHNHRFDFALEGRPGEATRFTVYF